jgi:hypothetical protein
MKTNFTRRDAITLAALGLVGYSTTSQGQAQPPDGEKAPAGDPKSEQGAAIKTRKASCNCGQLRVTCVGPDPERISLCHCNLCQKQSGSAFAIQTRFPREQVTIEGKATVWKISAKEAEALPYENCASLGATFHFCSVCGSTVHYTSHADADRIGIKIGTFKDPTFPQPKLTGHLQYGHPWSIKSLEGLSLEVEQ